MTGIPWIRYLRSSYIADIHHTLFESSGVIVTAGVANASVMGAPQIGLPPVSLDLAYSVRDSE